MARQKAIGKMMQGKMFQDEVACKNNRGHTYTKYEYLTLTTTIKQLHTVSA